MTALVGVFGPGAESAVPVLESMFRAMNSRGAANPEQVIVPGAVVASRRHAWEPEVPGWSGPVIVDGADWVVAADASLYYLADLRSRLQRAGVVLHDASSGSLLLAALRTWGAGFIDHVEGDYAVIAWHRRTGRVLLSRDFVGKRGLAYSLASDGTLVVASSPLPVVEHPAVSRSLNLDYLLVSIAGVHGHGNHTAFESVAVVPGGMTLAFESGRIWEAACWQPPPFSSDWEDDESDDAADELRVLIERAVLERLRPRVTAAVWMSGGWDSTSVFAAGKAILHRRALNAEILPFSMRYPAGDPGDEATYVNAVANRWSATVRWVPVADMPLFADADRRAEVREDPRVHPFESQIRTLGRVTQQAGIRTVLDGVGGDHLFMVSSFAVMADHLRAFRRGMLWGSWKAWGARRPRAFWRSCVLPLLSDDTRAWIGNTRGSLLRGYADHEPPGWLKVTPRFLEQLSSTSRREPWEGVSAWETRQLLTSPLVGRTLSMNHAMGLEEGVILSSPLLDRRIIEFASKRPLNERHAGSDSKVILRRAMRELIPPEVLAPRSYKTGLPSAYFRTEMAREFANQFRRLFGTGTSRLELLGLIDGPKIRRAAEGYSRVQDHQIGAMLQLTVEAERWLATRGMDG